MSGEPLSVAFISYHAAFDPSNGAARTMRDLLHLLRTAGAVTASLTGACVDDARGSAREVTLSTLQAEGRAHEVLGDIVATSDRGTPSLAYVPDVPSAIEPPPAQRDAFGGIASALVGSMRPDVVLTYGGGAVAQEVVRIARASGASVVFRIMNFRYKRRETFADVDGILVPARFVGDEYARTLSLDTTAIPCPVDWGRTLAQGGRRRFLTYVAPHPEKGAPWAARIFEELARHRPEIPLLVVEGRGRLEPFARLLSERARARVLASRTVADPRTFLAETRVLLMPSYVEPSGRLAQEAVINEIPVVASDRGGLPETLAKAGIVLPMTGGFDVRYLEVPDSARVAPWLEAIENLWDDQASYAAEQARAHEARERWRPERLAAEYLAYFERFRRIDRAGQGDAPMEALERAARLDGPVSDAAPYGAPPPPLQVRSLASFL